MNRQWITVLATALLLACDGGDAPAAQMEDTSPTVGAAQATGQESAPGGQRTSASAGPTTRDQRKGLGRPEVFRPWTGDLDGMEQRRLIRVLTVYGLGRYFLDGARESGSVHEAFKLFEDRLNKRLERGHLRVHVVVIPVARDELIPGLLAGRGDIAAAGLTITPERLQQVDFTQPVSRPLSEVLVTGPAAAPLAGIEGLAGQRVQVRASSSYRSSLEALNREFSEQGMAPVRIDEISELLEDEDLLEMVNQGLLDWAVVDDYKADILAGVFDQLTVRKDIVLREGGRIGFAVRKGSPLLLAELNDFVRSHRQGTLLGNVLINRYYRDFDWTRNALAPGEYGRFLDVVDIFQKYGEQYGFDYLIVTAQGYQESRLDQSARSHAGAVGIMQLLPSTAADPNVGIPDINQTESNIHAGVKYLDFLRKRYFGDPEIDRLNQTLLALAAYNAGPARIQRLRKEAEQQGYDPKRWFDHVEVVVAREVGREPVTYVANILKYYAAYRMSVENMALRAQERQRHDLGG